MFNIVEKLKYCPKGVKLYSTICGECKLQRIYEGLGFDVKSKNGLTYNFSYDGRFDLNGECCIFPSKENRNWDSFTFNFEPKIGDTVVDSFGNIFIYQGIYSDNNDKSNAIVYINCSSAFFATESINNFIVQKAIRYATDEEKKLLTDILKKNGYYYNSLTTFIIKRKFNVGDKIMNKLSTYPILTITFVNDMVYTVKNEKGEEYDIATKIVENDYKIASFSPNDFKPFDRLLVKRHNAWQIAHFGYFKNGVVFTEMGQPCNIDVVPYNNETKHLLGTRDEYNGFYKWW